MNTLYLILLLLLSLFSQGDGLDDGHKGEKTTGVSLIILGTVQDGGSPHIGCKKDCCRDLFVNPDKSRKVVSLGLIDHAHQTTYLIDATPDLPSQMKMLKNQVSFGEKETPDGIFLTHAHIGHYTGLMYLGKEALGAKEIPVFAMPKMKSFLESNGPWSQLVNMRNIVIEEMQDELSIPLTPSIKVTPFLVPHRDEFSETVGFTIHGPKKRVLFIPDIDKWELWEKDIIEEISEVDYAFLDATFYDAAEVNNRDMSEIPHPFIVESMDLFQDLPASEKQKIHFIHFNHTNPAIVPDSKQSKQILDNGFMISRMLDIFEF